MNKNKKISIIIPAYNCEKYIERCVKSILGQTYQNLEVIVINDGSKDNTIQVLNKLKSEDNRIIIIDKENTGVSDTRNLGLEKASGDYIGFVDSDDYIENDMYEKMINSIYENNSDISICAYYDENNGNKTEKLFPWNDEIRVFKEKNITDELLPHYIYKLKNERDSIYGTVWRMLIKSEIAKRNRFEKEIAIAEDLIYVIDCLSLANNVVTLNYCLYNYIRYENSSMGKYKTNLFHTNELVHKALIDRLNKVGFFKNNKLRYQLNRCYMYTSSISNIVKNNNKNFFEKRKEIKELLKIFNKDDYINISIFSELDVSRKIIYVIMRMRLYTLITILFILKNRVSRRR